MHTVAGAGRGQAGSNFALKVLLHVLHVSSMATHLTDHRQTSNRLTAETKARSCRAGSLETAQHIPAHCTDDVNRLAVFGSVITIECWPAIAPGVCGVDLRAGRTC